jgi:hypothetical protein
LNVVELRPSLRAGDDGDDVLPLAALRRWLKCGANGSRSDEPRSMPGDTMSTTGCATWHDLSVADGVALFYFGKGRA